MTLAHLCRGCGEPTTTPERGRCPACAAEFKKEHAHNYGALHKKRAAALIAQQPWCSNCGATEKLTADHVIPLAAGGHPHGELDVLCGTCNRKKGANVAQAKPAKTKREALPTIRRGAGARVLRPGEPALVVAATC